jgi:hypothetical protein
MFRNSQSSKASMDNGLVTGQHHKQNWEAPKGLQTGWQCKYSSFSHPKMLGSSYQREHCLAHHPLLPTCLVQLESLGEIHKKFQKIHKRDQLLLRSEPREACHHRPPTMVHYTGQETCRLPRQPGAEGLRLVWFVANCVSLCLRLVVRIE